MNRLTLLFAFSLYISVIANGQSRFLKGYIITNDSDTITGLIEYKGNQSNTQKCIYKENEQSEEHSYFAGDIKGYRYGDSKYYVSRIMQIKGQTDTLFLEYLVDGVVDLYCYYDADDVHYLIQAEKDSLVELKEVKQQIHAHLHVSKTYIYVLKSIFKDSPKISEKANYTVLDQGSLIKLTSAYHHEICPDKECTIYAKGHEGHLNVGITLGVNLISVSVPGGLSGEMFPFMNSDFGHPVSPSLGFFLLVNIPDVNANLYFQFEGSVTRLSLESNESYYLSLNGVRYDNDIEYKQTNFCGNAIFKYSFGEKKVRPVIQLGGFLNYGVGESYSRDTWMTHGNSSSHVTGTESPLNAVDYGPVAGLGIMTIGAKKKPVMVDIRFLKGLNLSKEVRANYFSLSTAFTL
jgi:hypothetical protein